MDQSTAMEAILQRMSKTDSNQEFLEGLKDQS
jgi:transcription termination factor Rho